MEAKNPPRRVRVSECFSFCMNLATKALVLDRSGHSYSFTPLFFISSIFRKGSQNRLQIVHNLHFVSLVEPRIFASSLYWRAYCTLQPQNFQLWKLGRAEAIKYMLGRPDRKNNHWFDLNDHWPLIKETRFSSVPPSNSLVSLPVPWGAFWADTAPFKGPKYHLECCFKNYRDTDRSGENKRTQIPGHCQEQLTQTLFNVWLSQA